MGLVKNMQMFIQCTSATIFACIFIKTPCTNAATTNRALRDLYHLKMIFFQIMPSVFSEDISCLNYISYFM